MKKNLISMAIILFFAPKYAACHPFLDPHTRPDYITDAIESTFKPIGDATSSRWGNNGSEYYDLINIHDEKLIQAIINNSPKKDFYFLDAGAGNFEWGTSMASKIDNMIREKSIPDDIHVHIISVRGEKNNGSDIRGEQNNGSDIRGEQNNESDNHSIIKNSVTTIHNIGFFKLEDFALELNRCNIDQPFDLIVSCWTLRHLVDPTGTLIQLYNRLNPHNGILLADGFFLAYKDNPQFEENDNENIFSLLANSNAPFLIHEYEVGRSLNRFILQRTNNNELHIPLEYDKIINIPDYQCNSRKVISFEKKPYWQNNIEPLDFPYTIKSNSSKNTRKEIKNVYHGTQLSKKLFKWLLSLNLICKMINNN